MGYQLPPDLDCRVQAYLGTGGYQNEDEVLRATLEEREQLKLRRWNEGNHIAIEQSEQGLSNPLDDEAVIARLRAGLAKEEIAE